MNKNNAVLAACEKAGGQSELAKVLSVSAGYVHQMVKGIRPVAPRHCRKIEDLYGISRKELAPTKWQEIWPELK